MNRKIFKRRIKKEIQQLIEQEQNSFKVSENDPFTSCVGRGVCCLDPQTDRLVKAKYSIDDRKRITCTCPNNTIKRACPY